MMKSHSSPSPFPHAIDHHALARVPPKTFLQFTSLGSGLGSGLPSSNFLFQVTFPTGARVIFLEKDMPGLDTQTHQVAPVPLSPFLLRASCLSLLCCWERTLLCLDCPLLLDWQQLQDPGLSPLVSVLRAGYTIRL